MALRCPARRQDLRTPDSPAHRRGHSIATRRSSDAPIPDQPSGATSPASRKDFTPKLGRTPCTPPSPSLLLESPASQDPLSSGRPISLGPAGNSFLFKNTHFWVPESAHLDFYPGGILRHSGVRASPRLLLLSPSTSNYSGLSPTFPWETPPHPTSPAGAGPPHPTFARGSRSPKFRGAPPPPCRPRGCGCCRFCSHSRGF